jgi:hypothetical protein
MSSMAHKPTTSSAQQCPCVAWQHCFESADSDMCLISDRGLLQQFTLRHSAADLCATFLLTQATACPGH